MLAIAGQNEQKEKKYKFKQLLQEPDIRRRWQKVRKYFFLRESTYDMTRKCNMRCEGCYYYEGDKQNKDEVTDPESWRHLMKEEKKRGITFVVLAGAEPCLVPDLCEVCYEEIPWGAIATNGVKKIPDRVGYKIHISAWGNDETSAQLRGYKNLLARQIDNYRNDPRSVFIYTFTPYNIDESLEVADFLVQNNAKISFNVFSAPVGYSGSLRHTPQSLQKMNQAMLKLIKQYPDNVIFSQYNATVHTHPDSLDDLFSCPYPRRNESNDIGLGRSFRQYRTDLKWDRSASCCVPDTDCADCRHYAAGSAVVTSKLYRHAKNPDSFKAWLDYVDTYLAVWVMGYEKDQNLCDNYVAPPGETKRT